MNIIKIESKQNQKIKNLVKLQKSNERNRLNLFLLEGIKEIKKAILAGYKLQSVFFCPEIISYEEVTNILHIEREILVFEVTLEVFSKIAYRETTGGLIVTMTQKNHDLIDFPITKNPLILVIEGVEKPGNLGAIYRTVDAAAFDGIIICDPKADLYNPNAIRASIGTVFNVPTALATTKNTIDFLNNNHISIFASYLEGSIPYNTVDYTKPSAIVMGTEATGITQPWVKAAKSNIIIPMQGIADSLNVSTATAVLAFEARRQRGFLFNGRIVD